jgi:hypothetical protein
MIFQFHREPPAFQIEPSTLLDNFYYLEENNVIKCFISFQVKTLLNVKLIHNIRLESRSDYEINLTKESRFEFIHNVFLDRLEEGYAILTETDKSWYGQNFFYKFIENSFEKYNVYKYTLNSIEQFHSYNALYDSHIWKSFCGEFGDDLETRVIISKNKLEIYTNNH